MLYWICPECGGECSPAIRECPACAGTPVISPASVGPVARKPAVTEEVLALVKNVQPIAPTPFEPQHGNGRSPQTSVLVLPELASREHPQVPPPETIESLVRPLVESTTTAAPPPLAKAEPPATAKPEPPRASQAIAIQAEVVLDSMGRSRTHLQPAIQRIVDSFEQQPNPRLLAPPAEIITAPAPLCLQRMRIPRPRISPVSPKPLNPADLMSGLNTPPLAGPCVPRELRNLTELHGASGVKPRKKATLPAWTVSFLIAVTLFLGVGSLLQYLAANREAKAAAPASSQSAADEPVSTPSEPPAAQTPSKLVEVTGLRIAGTLNRKPQLAFIVVNHSATQLANIGLQIAVRSASSTAGVAPLFRVSTTISALGPYQSREFRAELDPQFRASEIPDWQSLRADVSIR